MHLRRVGAGIRAADTRRVGGEMETETHEGEEDLFPEAGHFDFTEQRKVVEVALFCQGDGAAEHIGLESDVGVGEKQQIARRGFISLLEGLRLSSPARVQFLSMTHPNPRTPRTKLSHIPPRTTS